MIRLPFSQQKRLQILLTSFTKQNMCASLRFRIGYRPKNISYYQHDVENYMDQILDFSSYGRHKYIHSESSSL